MRFVWKYPTKIKHLLLLIHADFGSSLFENHRCDSIRHQTKPLLTTTQDTILGKGLNFALTLKQTPILDTISAVEGVHVKHPEAPTSLDWKLRAALDKWKQPQPNITYMKKKLCGI